MNNHISNEEELLKKIEIFKKQGINKIQVISDFDRTLTQAYFEGKKVQTSYSLIREGNYLSEEYPKLAFGLFDKYHPYEIDEKLSLKEKSKKMVEWWEEHLQVMIEHGMRKQVIEDIVLTNKTVYRLDFFNLSKILNDKKIPFLIFSAGLGDIIKGSLEYNNSFYKNMKIIANFYNYDEQGKVLGYKNKTIMHPFNKGEFSIKNTNYFDDIKERKNIILLGDTLGDLEMVKGVKYDNIIKIGFFNNSSEKEFNEFITKYDLVITNDSSMEPVTEIIQRII